MLQMPTHAFRYTFDVAHVPFGIITRIVVDPWKSPNRRINLSIGFSVRRPCIISCLRATYRICIPGARFMGGGEIGTIRHIILGTLNTIHAVMLCSGSLCEWRRTGTTGIFFDSSQHGRRRGHLSHLI